jgi:hypothetical protein
VGQVDPQLVDESGREQLPKDVGAAKDGDVPVACG